MSPRHEDTDEQTSRSRGGGVLLGGALLLALGSTGVLVLSNDLRWLRLGIVAALWAALVGAFLTAKYRRQLNDRRADTADLQAVYELELEREVAARREYELGVETEVRKKVEAESGEDIAALRGEIRSLRQTLETLLAGEVMVERYALHAESTRMRSLPEESPPRLRQGQVKRLTAAPARDADVVTEQFERVVSADVRPRQPAQPAQPVQPRVQRRPEPVQRQASRPEWPTRQAMRPATEQPRPEPTPVRRPEPAQARHPEPAPVRRVEPQPHPAEVSDRWFIPGALRGDSAAVVQPPVEPAAAPPPAAPPPAPPPAAPSPPTPRRHARVQDTGTQRPVEPSSNGRRHARHAEPESYEVDRTYGTGGRRHRAEGTPSRQDISAAWRSRSAEPPAPQNGTHAGDRYEEPGTQSGMQSGTQSGTHAAGRSVTDLLAAHGATPTPRRRRRRDG